MARTSSDNGLSWSEDRVLAEQLGWLPRNVPITMASGELLLPLSGKVGDKSGSFFMKTGDNGKTWQGPTIAFDINLDLDASFTNWHNAGKYLIDLLSGAFLNAMDFFVNRRVGAKDVAGLTVSTGKQPTCFIGNGDVTWREARD